MTLYRLIESPGGNLLPGVCFRDATVKWPKRARRAGCQLFNSSMMDSDDLQGNGISLRDLIAAA